MNVKEKKLYLIDGHALIYRAYYALAKNPLTNSKGVPTGAIYGFVNYLIRLIDSYVCPYMAVVMDSRAPTFRHEMYEQYKANRKAMPDDLKAQMPLIDEIVAAFNIPLIRKDGLEADDLLASITSKAVALDFDVFLVTKDKDLMQLVGPRVKMLAPDGTGTLQLFETKDVIAKMGIGPEKIVDYLALIGDASDNIPGVPSIGPKTAIKILESCGNVDALLSDPSLAGTSKLAQKIAENRELLKISKELATLRYDAELPCGIEAFERIAPDREKCMAFFKEYELHSFLRNSLFGKAASITVSGTVLIQSTQQLEDCIKRIEKAGTVCFYTVTQEDTPRAASLIGIAVALDEKESVYIPVTSSTDAPRNAPCAFLEMMKPLFENPAILKTGHNLKSDYQVLKNYEINLKGISFDTMIAAYLIDPGKRASDLDSLVQQWLETERAVTADIAKSKKDKTLAGITPESLSVYAGETVCAIAQLRIKLEPVMTSNECMKLFREIEMPLVAVLAELEWHGMLIDTTLLKSMSEEYAAVLKGISDEVYQLAGMEFNINSPKQVGEVLFDKLQLPAVKKTKSGTHSTSVDILEKLAEKFPVVQKILDYREVQKLLSTYIDALPQQILPCSGRVHSSFNQTVTATGRLSSTNPNLQNIPVRTDAGKRIREAFIAKPGFVLVSADYSQIELRILAHLSKDHFLRQAFLNDEDIHTQTASAIFGTFPELVTPDMRRAAKTINFGLMYGMGPINLARQLGISFGEARNFIDTYFAQFPTIKTFMESTIQRARETGYTETLFGRRRYHPEINASNRNIREAAERTAINTPVQGTAADIMKIAMIQIQDEIDTVCKDAKMLLQVHDELVFEVPENDADTFCKWAVTKMSSACTLDVPLKVDGAVGMNWSIAH